MKEEDKSYKAGEEELKAFNEKQEKERIVNGIAFNFQKGIDRVKSGKEHTADLYSGDFVNMSNPPKFILAYPDPLKKDSGLSIDQEELITRFSEMIVNEVMETSFPETFLRQPEPRTKFLRNFLLYSSGKKLLDIQLGLKLRSEPGTLLMVTVDRYSPIDNFNNSVSETWTLTKIGFNVDPLDDGPSKKYKIKPRSLVQTQFLPALPSGK